MLCRSKKDFAISISTDFINFIEKFYESAINGSSDHHCLILSYIFNTEQKMFL